MSKAETGSGVIIHLDDEDQNPSTPKFTILPRARKTLKERLIAKTFIFDNMPVSVYEESIKRLGVTEDELAEMTEEEKNALVPKIQEILNDMASGLTLKQVYKLREGDTYSPKDGDTLRAYVQAAYEDIGGVANTGDPIPGR